MLLVHLNMFIYGKIIDSFISILASVAQWNSDLAMSWTAEELWFNSQ
jgi:hypothetical protein